MTSQPGWKQLQYTYYQKSHEVKASRKCFFRDHAENVAGKLVPDLFLFLKKTLKVGKCKWCEA